MSFRITVLLAAMLAILGVSNGHAQTVLPAPGQAATPMYTPHEAQPTSQACWMSGPGCSPNEDNNGTTLYNDPLLTGRQVAENEFAPGPHTPGWFYSSEVNLVVPHVAQQMNQFVGPFQTGLGFHLSNTGLDWGVMPEFQLGYRLQQGAGEILFTYQFLNSNGSSVGVDAFGNPAAINSRVSVNVFDLEYASREFALGPWCDMKWLIGVRGANAFFGTTASNAANLEAVENNYIGVGPVFGLNVGKVFPTAGFGVFDVFSRIEFGVIFGPDAQFFNAGTATFNQYHNNLVIIPKVEAGIGWSPAQYERIHLATGYVFQYWSNLAEQSPNATGNFPDSRGSLTIQGVFFRAEWNF